MGGVLGQKQGNVGRSSADPVKLQQLIDKQKLYFTKADPSQNDVKIFTTTSAIPIRRGWTLGRDAKTGGYYSLPAELSGELLQGAKVLWTFGGGNSTTKEEPMSDYAKAIHAHLFGG
jgi:hypothetical protein